MDVPLWRVNLEPAGPYPVHYVSGGFSLMQLPVGPPSATKGSFEIWCPSGSFASVSSYFCINRRYDYTSGEREFLVLTSRTASPYTLSQRKKCVPPFEVHLMMTYVTLARHTSNSSFCDFPGFPSLISIQGSRDPELDRGFPIEDWTSRPWFIHS